MKFEELKKMSAEELREVLKEARELTLKLRFKVRAGELKTWQEIEKNKKKIARILTIFKSQK